MRCLAPVQCAKDLPRFERKGGPQRLAMHREDLTVVPGVGNDQDNDIESRVALLERQSAHECLEVIQLQFGLETDTEPVEPRLGVDRPPIADHGNRNLEHPRRSRRQASPQPVEEPQVARVSHRLPIQERPPAELEAH